MKTIKNVLQSMLTENTGTHFLDSGGSDGRQWQRNQGKVFGSEPRIDISFWDGVMDYITVSTYHYLSDVLSLDITANKINAYLDRQRVKDVDAHWVQECIDLISEKYDVSHASESINTCNGENNLSQVLQFITFVVNGEPYVLLQIHGGADVRGGYTDAVCFKLEGYLTGNVDIYGSVNGVDVCNTYNGYSITDDSGNDIEVKESDEYGFDFYVMEEVYMYME